MEKLRGVAFQQGQHICAVYDTPEEQLAVAAAYLADGLQVNERCIYATDSPSALDLFRSRVRELGVDAADAERRKALVLLTTQQAHLPDGKFDCERMLRMLDDSVEEALNDGFSGLRTCGDMSWLIEEPPGSHQVVEYEALLNQFFRNVPGSGMCQYDSRRLPAGLLAHAGLVAHSTVVVEMAHRENPYYGVRPDGSAERRPPTPIDAQLAKLRSQD